MENIFIMNLPLSVTLALPHVLNNSLVIDYMPLSVI